MESHSLIEAYARYGGEKMPEMLDSGIRVARKEHSCSYCRGIIKKGEKYDWSKLKYNGELYEWKAHLDCQMVSSEIWNYVDPDEGMTEDDFCEGVKDVCQAFICPGCPKNPENQEDAEYDECDECYCLDKVVELLKENELVEVYEKERPWRTWKLKPRKKEAENGSSEGI